MVRRCGATHLNSSFSNASSASNGDSHLRIDPCETRRVRRANRSKVTTTRLLPHMDKNKYAKLTIAQRRAWKREVKELLATYPSEDEEVCVEAKILPHPGLVLDDGRGRRRRRRPSPSRLLRRGRPPRLAASQTPPCQVCGLARLARARCRARWPSLVACHLAAELADEELRLAPGRRDGLMWCSHQCPITRVRDNDQA